MADGPRCKRRKQANPKRSSVTDFNNGLEASSDSDDEDKLHIVEEESLQEPEAAAAAAAAAAATTAAAAATTAAAAEGTTPPDSNDATATVLPPNGSWNGVKEEYVSEEEEEEAAKDALVEEILQQGDTAVIYPEAPDDEQSPVETGGADENGTPDSFSALHTCPYCSRGYKRNASLKEHIKYRHETSEDNYSCSHCSYTFTYRSQLERHMSHHRGTRDHRQVSQSTGGTGGPRKFKCTECNKAFKYKHHLKEHLRIHSGEKPYECSNCKKRFSHSGSYSSHISSKKCVGSALGFPNGATRTLIKPAPPTAQTTPVVIAPARIILKEKTESKPLQEQLPITQIKSEPVEYSCKPVMAAPATSAGTNGVVNGGISGTAAATTLPQGVAMVVPTVGLMSPISINLSELQNVLKLALDGNVLRQVLGTANGVVTPGKHGIVLQQSQQQIISLPAFVDADGNTKIIINYSITPAAGTTAATQPFIIKNNPPVTVTSIAAAPSPSVTGKTSTPEAADLSLVKTEPEDSVPVSEEAASRTEMDNLETSDFAQFPNSTSTCLLCEECPDNLEALHLLQHRKAANGEAVDSAALDPSFAALLNEAGVTLEEPPVEDIVSLLKTHLASNANPRDRELTKISEDVDIPLDVVRKWFAKMKKLDKSCSNTKAVVVSRRTRPRSSLSADTMKQNGEGGDEDQTHSRSTSPSDSTSQSLNSGGLVIVKSEPEDPDYPDSQAQPLDLSLPKHLAAAAAKITIIKPLTKQQEQPLNLTCLRKEQLAGRTIYVTTAQSGKIVSAAQLPTLVAIAGQSTVRCISAINTTTKRTILIPQLTYTYATTPGNASGAKTVVLNGHKEEKRLDSSSDGLSAVEELNDLESAGKKRRLDRLDNGVYPCDLCSKVFQKGSSLLRHKYEHTGKRPHECTICQKAFKHKHHLIEHTRLHSGEKPYECDKCGKRFSHSGSYSQHMNHRYSYCKKDGSPPGPHSLLSKGHSEVGSPGTGRQSDSRTTTPPSQLDSDEEEDDTEDDEAMCMDDIRVVQVDDGDCEIYEGNFDDEDDDDDDDEEEEEEAGSEEEAQRQKEKEFVCDVVEIELGDEHMEEEEMEEEEEGGGEEEQEAAGVEPEEMEDCEANTDKSIREGSDGIEPPEAGEVVTDAK